MPKAKKLKGISRRLVVVSWDEMLKELKQYKQVNGNCNVSQRYKANPKLGTWVDTQRQAYKKGKLSKERIESLNGIGFEWELRKLVVVSWDERLEELKQYKQQNGNSNVSTKDKANKELASWVSYQRTLYKKGKLSSKQIESMNGIGFEWVLMKHIVHVSWDVRFEQLKEYQEKHGHCNISTLDRDNKQLGQWVHYQRTTYNEGKLSYEQINRLERIGFKWVLGHGYRQAREVSDAEGSPSGREEEAGGATPSGGTQMMIPMQPLPPAAAAEDTDNTFGGETAQVLDVGNAREKLSPDQKERLEGIGFVWVSGWDERFKELKQYNEEHGNCNVPNKYKLGQWVTKQRTKYKKGKLSPEQIGRLNEIGFVWVLSRGRRPAEVSDNEDSALGEEEEAGRATSSGDTQIMIPSSPPLPPVAEAEETVLAMLGVDINGGKDTNGEYMLTDEYQGHNQQGDVGKEEFANDDSSFHMDEEDDHQEDDGEENDDIDSPTNVSPATEQEGGRSSSVESQQDLRQKLDEANARIASLLQPDIVDLTNEDSTICEDNQKESAGAKSVEAAVYAVRKIKMES